MFALKEKLAPVCITAATVCIVALAGCGSGAASSSTVAATVNGTEISEETVTTQIEQYRSGNDMADEQAWAEFLNSAGYTPESFREMVIDSLVDQELEKQGAAEAKVEVSDEELNEAVDAMRANYDSDETFQDALSKVGLTEETYRERVKQSMLEEKLIDAVVSEEDAKADDETVLSYVQMYASAVDGMKRSSHILFAADDEETAKQVLDELNNGADFAELAKEYSTDTASGEQGGDVGWDALNSFVDAYTQALGELDKGETSGLVTSEYGIHIIRCTDVWNAPKEIKKLSDVPDELVSLIRTQMADPAAKQNAFQKYLDDLREKADIQKNPIPENAPYNVDVSKYVSSSSTEGDEAADGDAEDADAEDADVDAEGVEVEVEGEDAAGDDADASESTSESSSESSDGK